MAADKGVAPRKLIAAARDKRFAEARHLTCAKAIDEDVDQA